MASLKEIKGRISSVKSTQKITAAMKMVASAKLRKAQSQMEHFLPYQYKLNEMLHSFLSAETDFQSPLSKVRPVRRLAIVVASSNSSLCGAFNSNVEKQLHNLIEQYLHLECKYVEIYPIGKKVEEYVRRMTLPVKIKGSHIALMEHPHFAGAKSIANQLIEDFLQHKIDKVELLYNHFKSTAMQVPTIEQYLPLQLSVNQANVSSSLLTDYIVEPDKKALIEALIPKALHSRIYALLLDSAAAEQAARTVAMQIATDNANEILDDLTIQYNKQRQQAITAELLDILGGSEALK